MTRAVAEQASDWGPSPRFGGCGQNEIAVGFLQDCDVRDWPEARKQQEMNMLLRYTILYVDDVRASLAFYERAFGLVPVVEFIISEGPISATKKPTKTGRQGTSASMTGA